MQENKLLGQGTGQIGKGLLYLKYLLVYQQRDPHLNPLGAKTMDERIE